MANGSGTNLFVPYTNGDTNVTTCLTDASGNAVLVSAPSANVPAAKTGYAIGCILINSTSGSPYVNVGTTASCSFLAIVS